MWIICVVTLGFALTLVGTVLTGVSSVRLVACVRARLDSQRQSIASPSADRGESAATAAMEDGRALEFRAAEGQLRIGLRLAGAGVAFVLAAMLVVIAQTRQAS